MAHWTTETSDAFIRRVTFDYWTQLQKRFDSLPLTQMDLARIFGVSESAVSQTLNNSKNPTLKTLYNYAQAAKLKFALVPYEDTDPNRGPINSEIFTLCWEKAGRPRTFGQVRALPIVNATAFNSESLIAPPNTTYFKQRRHALTMEGDTQQSLFVFLGAGASLNTKDMLTAITHSELVLKNNLTWRWKCTKKAAAC